MANLNASASAVIRAGRIGLTPPDGERERLEALIEHRLAAFVPHVTVNSAPPLSDKWRRLALAVGVGALGGTASLWSTPKHIDSPVLEGRTTSPKEPARDVAPLSSADSAAPKLAPPGEVLSVTRRVEPQAAVPTSDGLAREVALLSRATSLLRAGRPADALSLLNEHQRKFPKGMLEIERTAVGAQALCSLGRVNEGRAALARLAPQSPAAGRAQQVCDGAASTGAR